MYQAADLKYVIRPWLRGYGQLVFLPSSLVGGAILLAVAVNGPLMSLGAFIAGLVATLVGWRFGALQDYAQGVYGLNGSLIGIASVMCIELNVWSWSWIIFASALSVILVAKARSMKFPVLTAPFIVLALLGMAMFPAAQESVKGMQLLWHEEPTLSAMLAGVGQLAFQASLFSGLIILVAVAWVDWRMAMLIILGSTLASLLGSLANFDNGTLASGVLSFNLIFTLLGIYKLFETYPAWYWCMAALMISGLLSFIVIALGFTVFTLPFVISLWWLLYIQYLTRQQLAAS